MRYTLLTLAGSAIWCFAFAGIGWALGSNWETFHHAFRYADYAVGGASSRRDRVAGLEAAGGGRAPGEAHTGLH